jgi:glycosidase
LFAYPGVPAIYYGDEIGIEGGSDPDCRRSMIWDEKLWDRELLEFYKKLIELRKTSQALRKGVFIPGTADNGLFTFERGYGNERVVVCLNNSPVAVEYEIGKPYDILLSRSARIDTCTLLLDPYAFAVLRKTTENV